MDGSCKAYGESLLHSKKQVEHERLRLAKTVGRLTNSYRISDGKPTASAAVSMAYSKLHGSLFHYKRTRPVVNNCIPTPFLAFSPGPWRGIVIYSAYAHALARALIFHEHACVGACAYISRRVWAPDYPTCGCQADTQASPPREAAGTAANPPKDSTYVYTDVVIY